MKVLWEYRPTIAYMYGVFVCLIKGPLTGGGGGVPCRMSNLRNANVLCHLNGNVTCRL